jgi:hypothetical protein
MLVAIQDAFGSRVEHLTVDCANVPGCGTLLNKDGQEKTGFFDVLAVRFSSYGLYVLGGQNQGPDDLIELESQAAGLPTTEALVLNGVIYYHGFINSTIDAHGYRPGNQPAHCGWVGGLVIYIANGHCEGTADGLIIGNPTMSSARLNFNSASGLTMLNWNSLDNELRTHIIHCDLPQCNENTNDRFIGAAVRDDLHLMPSGQPTLTKGEFYYLGGSYKPSEQTLFSLEPGDPWRIFNPVTFNGAVTLSRPVRTGTNRNTDLAGELTLRDQATITYTSTQQQSTHPECWAQPQFNPVGPWWLTYDQVQGRWRFTVHFSAAVSGTLSFGCTDRE